MPSAVDIAREIGNTAEIKRKSIAVAFTDLPGVPEGTRGKVALVNGWDKWIRYHVLFENGVELSNIDRADLAPAKQYDELAAKRADAIERGVFDRSASSADAADAGDGGTAVAAGATVNGVAIPAHLLERSKSARARLAA